MFHIKKTFIFSLAFVLMTSWLGQAYAQQFNKDLFIKPGDVKAKSVVLRGESVRLYVTVQNNSSFDLTGVVKFYDEKTAEYIGTDQPFSALSGRTDDVFIDWKSDVVGNHPVAVRIFPWETSGDNPDNNKVVKNIFIDIDSDRDGKSNQVDPDDDNDGVPDVQDAFPLDENESKDTDKDGLGDNRDTDDDNDGVSDAQDAFPLDENESKDTDGDGVGDNQDAFPEDPNETSDADGDGLGDNDDPNDENKGPQLSIQTSEQEAKSNQRVTFNALKTIDLDGEIVKYEWNFGDGTTAEGVVVDHVFENPGDYYVTLKATDDLGESREQQVKLTVRINWSSIALLAVFSLFLLLIFSLLIPSSRFHHKKWLKKKVGKK